jgi:outer membrane protein TolC
VLAVLTALSGCHPTQPFYLHERGDLAHYLDTATQIEYPDVNKAALSEAAGSQEPLTILDPQFDRFWDLTLEEAICITLYNSKVVRTLTVSPSTNIRNLADILPDSILRAPEAAATVYDPALVEANPGSLGRNVGISNAISPEGGTVRSDRFPGSLGAGEAGVEAALAEFDAHLSGGMRWNNTDRQPNVNAAGAPFQSPLRQDWRNFVRLDKRAATGTEFLMMAHAEYQDLATQTRPIPSDWTAFLTLEARHPLLRGSGTQVNRSNVVVARINTDRELAEFEIAVRNLVFDVERAYWDLYFQYRNLEARKVARDSALVQWKKIKTKQIVSVPGGEAEKEAQARQQYFRFRSEVESSLRDVFKVENRFRYLLGLAASDGRMIRPADEPVTSKVDFDWGQILCEALYRSPELRRQKWLIKRREMELIVARNDLLPELDVAAFYRWLGRGDDLIEANRRGLNFPAPGSLAWDELSEGRYQESGVNLQFHMPLGFRKELAGVRWAQLNIARDKAVLDEMELELSHALTAAYQDLEAYYHLMQTNFNWRVAAQKEVDSVQAAFEAGTATLDLLLRAQQSRADAETAYYQSLQQYNQAIAHVHYRKSSLLQYNGVQLAEGPWPEKAYFDALGHARRRDASRYLNYGYTRPRVMSRGPVDQTGSAFMVPQASETSPSPAGSTDPADRLEEVPEGYEMPPVPDPSEYEPPQAPVETATMPEGPELAPPRLMSIPRTGAGLKAAAAGNDTGGGFDWGVVQSRVQPITPARQTPAPVVPASHTSVLKQPGHPAPAVPARGSSIKVKTRPQPAPAPAGNWKTAG